MAVVPCARWTFVFLSQSSDLTPRQGTTISGIRITSMLGSGRRMTVKRLLEIEEKPVCKPCVAETEELISTIGELENMVIFKMRLPSASIICCEEWFGN